KQPIRRGVGIVAEPRCALPQSVLGPLSIVDVEPKSAPFDDPASCIARRMSDKKVPAICPVRSAQAGVRLNGPDRSREILPACEQPRQILRVHRSLPPAAIRLVERKPGIIAPVLIQGANLSVRKCRP